MPNLWHVEYFHDHQGIERTLLWHLLGGDHPEGACNTQRWLLSNYLADRRDGPVFLTGRDAKSDALLGPGDRDEQGRARLPRAGRDAVRE